MPRIHIHVKLVRSSTSEFSTGGPILGPLLDDMTRRFCYGAEQVISMNHDPNRSSFDYSCENEKSMVIHPQIDHLMFLQK